MVTPSARIIEKKTYMTEKDKMLLGMMYDANLLAERAQKTSVTATTCSLRLTSQSASAFSGSYSEK